ncbi:MAG: tetratricopeptide repeat protein, partial [bacterium]|nr:tetratricopeptide repeat protein [bacterium]
NLGLANIQIAQRENSPRHLRDGYALLLRIERLFDRDPEVLEALGTALILQGNATEGRRLSEKAVEAQKAFALRYPSLGAAWWELGSAEEAVATLEKAIRLDPLLESAHHMLAKVYQETGQPEKAAETWKRYLVHMPGNIYARQALARFDSGNRASQLSP